MRVVNFALLQNVCRTYRYASIATLVYNTKANNLCLKVHTFDHSSSRSTCESTSRNTTLIILKETLEGLISRHL